MMIRSCSSHLILPRFFLFKNNISKYGIKAANISSLVSQHSSVCIRKEFKHTKHLCISNSYMVKRSNSSEASKSVYEHILASEPIHFAQSVLEYGHTITGLPWWASIAVTTVALRALLTLPLAIYSQKIQVRIENLHPEILHNARVMFQQRFASQATQEKWNEAKMKKVITKMMKNSAKQIYVRDNCHPAKASIMILTQIPLWISVSLSLRNMTGAISSNFYLDPNCVVPTLSDGGTLWFTNLVLPDPLYILPLAVGLLNLINIELQTLNVREGSKFPKLVTNMLRGLSIIIIPIAAYMPSAITLYWMTSASYSVAQNLFLKLPKVRLALNLVPKSTMNDGQIKNIRTLIKDKYSSSKTNKVK